MVWGEVHDENAWSFGGVAGHAGIFSTADDMAILGQTILNGGAYNDTLTGNAVANTISVTPPTMAPESFTALPSKAAR